MAKNPSLLSTPAPARSRVPSWSTWNPAKALPSGLVEKIGEPVDGHYKHEYNGEKHELEEPIHDHEQGLKRVLGFFDEYGPKLADAGIVARWPPRGPGRLESSRTRRS